MKFYTLSESQYKTIAAIIENNIAALGMLACEDNQYALDILKQLVPGDLDVNTQDIEEHFRKQGCVYTNWHIGFVKDILEDINEAHGTAHKLSDIECLEILEKGLEDTSSINTEIRSLVWDKVL